MTTPKDINDALDFTSPVTVNSEGRVVTAPPASGVLPGTIPIGQPMKVGSLLPEEKAELEKHGWREGDPIPSNMAVFLNAQSVAPGTIEGAAEALRRQAQLEATDPDYMPPPASLDTPPLHFSEDDIRDIADLTPDEQERAQQVAASVLKAARENKLLDDEMPAQASKGVRDAIRAASQPTLQDDTDSDTYATGMPKQQSNFEVDTSPCSRCGFPKHLSDPIEVTEQDKDDFVQCMLGQKQFEKVYRLFGGKLAIKVRSLMPYEADLIWAQISADYHRGRLKTAIDERDFHNRYRTCLQVIGISGLNRPVVLPQSYEEWEKVLGGPSINRGQQGDNPDTLIRLIYDTLQKKLAVSESIHRTLAGTVVQFNQLQIKLEANSQNPDFWKATDAS